MSANETALVTNTILIAMWTMLFSELSGGITMKFILRVIAVIYLNSSIGVKGNHYFTNFIFSSSTIP